MAETPDQILTQMAGPTGGVARRADLLQAGMSSTSIERRLSTGYLVRATSGVYQVPVLRTSETDLWRAVLSVPESVLSRQTAARLHGMTVPVEQRIHVTAPKGAGRTVDGVFVHESRLLRSEDLTSIGALPVTSPERTLVDLAADYSMARLRFLIDKQYAGTSASPFIACVQALLRPGVPGARKLKELVGLLDDVPLAASELERRIWRGLNTFDIIGFSPQFIPPWFDGRRGIVDFANAELRTIIEGDGRRWHDSQQAMAEDRGRDRRAAEHGWLVLRLSWHEVVHRPAATFDDLQRVLCKRRNSMARLAA